MNRHTEHTEGREGNPFLRACWSTVHDRVQQGSISTGRGPIWLHLSVVIPMRAGRPSARHPSCLGQSCALPASCPRVERRLHALMPPLHLLFLSTI